MPQTLDTSPSNRRIFVRQTLLLTKANLKSRYRKTFAGFLWVVMNPIIMYLAQSVVFRYFLKLTLPNYFLFLGSGLLPWIFISQTLDMTTSIFQNNGILIKSFSLNPLVYLSAQLLDNFINFTAAMVIILVPLIVLHPVEYAGVLLIPIPLTLLILSLFSICWIAATLQVFLRDTRFIISFLISVAYFATPIFYPKEFVPEPIRWMVDWNPIYIMISPIRAALYEFEVVAFWKLVGRSFLFSLLTLWAATTFWKKKKNELLFNI